MSSFIPSRARLAVGALFLITSACTVEFGLDDRLYSCTGDEQCPPGWRCEGTYCVAGSIAPPTEDVLIVIDGSRRCTASLCGEQGLLCPNLQEAECLDCGECQDRGGECQPDDGQCCLPEICDGLDNDCDGQLDEPPEGMACLTKGVCQGVLPLCPEEGEWKCSYPEAYQKLETSCHDGKDNDCNGLTDCKDPSCAAQCPLFEQCQNLIDDDEDGLIDCQDPDCLDEAVCAMGEEICANGADDDRNGLVDCDDPGCRLYPACIPEICDNAIDDDGDRAVDCYDSECWGTEACPHQEICNNAMDDDGDGLTDCEDPGCQYHHDCIPEICDNGIDDDNDRSLDCYDSECWGTEACPHQEICNNGIDDNGDGLTDCEEPGCQPYHGCLPEICDNHRDDDGNDLVDCADPECNEQICGPHGRMCLEKLCICPDDTGREDQCADDLDNDCDGLIDCEDPDCQGDLCGELGQICKDSACICQGGDEEALCHDNLDNDCDGLIDCADPHCLGAPCGEHGQICKDNACICPGGDEEALCDDNLDNDCDGLIDCADPHCLGDPCDELGRTCKDSACICPGGDEEALCDDNLDNDCDGLIDCADPHCLGDPCGEHGRICKDSACICPGGDEETLCHDNLDNDCDGLIDCDDPNCVTISTCQCRFGESRLCWLQHGVCAGKTQACSPDNTWEPCDYGPDYQDGEASCGDGLDNDCDGLSDCLDGDCAWATCGEHGRRCGNGECTCPGGEDVEITCNDDQDNDCNGQIDCHDPSCHSNPYCHEICSNNNDDDGDGLIDCADEDCQGQSCGDHGMKCVEGSCSCDPPNGRPEAMEISCDDGFDNDCNGLSDCDDGNCEGRACGINGFVCLRGDCACSNGDADVPETLCHDELDNDCDGLRDCDDPDCRINGERDETLCNGRDDDCDGHIDDGTCGYCSACTESQSCHSELCVHNPLEQGEFELICAAGNGECYGDIRGQLLDTVTAEGLTITACLPHGLSCEEALSFEQSCESEACPGRDLCICGGDLCREQYAGPFCTVPCFNGDSDSECPDGYSCNALPLLPTSYCVLPEDCANGYDDDLDGLTDCLDPDCAEACVSFCGSCASSQECSSGLCVYNPFTLPDRERESVCACSGQQCAEALRCGPVTTVEGHIQEGCLPHGLLCAEYNNNGASCSMEEGAACEGRNRCTCTSEACLEGWGTCTIPCPAEGAACTGGLLCRLVPQQNEYDHPYYCLPPESCTNGYDDDLDNMTDCRDDECFLHPDCPTTEFEVCDNGIDDDGDGLTDCEDLACAGLTCWQSRCSLGLCLCDEESDCGDDYACQPLGDISQACFPNPGQLCANDCSYGQVCNPSTGQCITGQFQGGPACGPGCTLCLILPESVVHCLVNEQSICPGDCRWTCQNEACLISPP